MNEVAVVKIILLAVMIIVGEIVIAIDRKNERGNNNDNN